MTKQITPNSLIESLIANSGFQICDLSGANNLIPIEIALKITNKIKANERFSAYIVIPMWPEGNPTGAATQRILYWQVSFNISASALCLVLLFNVLL